MNISSDDVIEAPLANWPPRTTDAGAETFAAALTRFVLQRRWYRSKARAVRNSRIYDVIALPNAEWCFVLLELEFAEGDRAIYFCTLTTSSREPADAPIVAQLSLRDTSGALVREGLGDDALSGALLDAVAQERTLLGERGRLSASRTGAFQELAGTAGDNLPARASKAEQSNSAIFYGDRFILKVFRRLDAGINPDLEIGRFLTSRGFRHTPAVAGDLEYVPDRSAPMSVCILQQFVPNRGDAWEFTLAAARDFFSLRTQPPPAAPALLASATPAEQAEAERLVGPYLDSARLLGRRTAELHVALTPDSADEAFAPEEFTPGDRDALHRAVLSQMSAALDLVRSKRDALPQAAAADAERFLALEAQLRAGIGRLCDTPIETVRIRTHGDYHLGQVLVTDNDFMIIDFEGEPARPLEERRGKGAAMRDVAGMIRSFQYAAYSALPDGADPGWADYWSSTVSRAFLASYFAESQGQRFVPTDPAQRRILLDTFVIEKALYEVLYELNNRPDWVQIPLRGIIALMHESRP